MLTIGGNMIVVKRKKTVVEKLKESLQNIFNISKDLNTNILHNYKWREMIQKDIMEKYGLKVEDVSGITGDDFISADIKKGDYKSTKGKRLKNGLLSRSQGGFEFDKMNDPPKRKDTMKYDCLFFTWFIDTEPVASVLLKKEKAIQQFRKMAVNKIKDFLILMEKNEKQGKRISRDSIKFTYTDVINIEDAIYLNHDKEVTLKEFMSLFEEVKEE
jgi:hypothetical protein